MLGFVGHLNAGVTGEVGECGDQETSGTNKCAHVHGWVRQARLVAYNSVNKIFLNSLKTNSFD